MEMIMMMDDDDEYGHENSISIPSDGDTHLIKAVLKLWLPSVDFDFEDF